LQQPIRLGGKGKRRPQPENGGFDTGPGQFLGMGVEIAQAKHVLMEISLLQASRDLQQGRFRAADSQSADDVQNPVGH
jgi:hypothetical protein